MLEDSTNFQVSLHLLGAVVNTLGLQNMCAARHSCQLKRLLIILLLSPAAPRLCCAVLCHAVFPVTLQVVSAHAASIGDNLLGVPLNCSAGLNADAVALLQEAGMWQAAAALTARTLAGTERAQALSRWASHVRHHEGSVWRCVGILTSAGCLQAAAQVGGWGCI
jgi:hypothetical protein